MGPGPALSSKAKAVRLGGGAPIAGAGAPWQGAFVRASALPRAGSREMARVAVKGARRNRGAARGVSRVSSIDR